LREDPDTLLNGGSFLMRGLWVGRPRRNSLHLLVLIAANAPAIVTTMASSRHGGRQPFDMGPEDSSGQQKAAAAAPGAIGDPIPTLRTARCECRNCGVHTMAAVGYKVAGACPNCGSFDMAPVDP
jgi:hypothetical protein